jgi:putative sugar O-methyltransferase
MDVLEYAKDKLAKINRLCEEKNFYERVPVSEMWLTSLRNIHRELIANATNPEKFIQDALSAPTFSWAAYAATTKGSEVVRRNVFWYIKWMKKMGRDLSDFPHAMEQSKHACQGTIVKVDNRSVSPEFLRLLAYIIVMDQHLSLNRPNLRILELGSGYGGMARVFGAYKPDAKFTLIDLPECLFFAYIYLKLHFPEKQIVYAGSENEISDNVKTSDFLLVPSVLAENLEGQRYDIFINTQSLGEMDNKTISFWGNLIQTKLRVESVFLCNRFLNSCEIESNRHNENLGSLFLDDRWCIRYWHFDPPFYHNPYIVTHFPKSLCIIASREQKDADLRDKNYKRSWDLFWDVYYEDWVQWGFNLQKRIDLPGRMQGVYAFDGSMDGTLFKLWESIRLHPTKYNVFLMLYYLKPMSLGFLRKDFIEEHIYYESLFRDKNKLNPTDEVIDLKHLDAMIDHFYVFAKKRTKLYESFLRRIGKK